MSISTKYRSVFFILLLIGCQCFTNDLFAQNKVMFMLEEVADHEVQQIGIRGNTQPLSWESSIPLIKNGDTYTVTIDFQSQTGEVEYKFVQFGENEEEAVTWENIPNRVVQLKKDEEVISHNEWNIEQLINIEELPILESQGLLEDYALIEKMILDVHPGTYRYNSRAEINEGLRLLREQLSSTKTHAEAYLVFAKMIAQIKCDHTKVGLNNQNRVINSIIHRQPDKLPFTFKWLEQRMIVEYDATNTLVLPRGTEIVQINGISSNQILEEMLPYVAADGATDLNRIYKTEIEGFDFRYNVFDVFYPLLFPIEDQRIKLEVIYPNSSESEIIEVTTLTREGRAETLGNRYQGFPKSRDDMWEFEFIEPDIALLRLNSFGSFGWKAMTIDWQEYLKEAFRDIEHRNTNHLIIDIRKNTGGADPMAAELFSYLDIKEHISEQVYRDVRTRYLNFPDTLKPFVQTWGDNPWFYSMDTDNFEDGYYIFEGNGDNFSKKEEYNFDGEVYLLTSSANTSLAYYTAQNFKRHQLGTIVGQETGGNMRDINGGQILFLRLPYSGIEIDFSIMGGFAFGDQPNQGVMPDIVVEKTIEDFISGKDAELMTVLELIENK